MLKFSCAAVTKAAGSSPNKDNFELGGKCAPMNHGDFSAVYEGNSKEPFIAAAAGGAVGTEHITKGKYASFMVCRELAYTDGNLPADFDECAENMTEAILNSNDMVCETIKNEEAGSKSITIASALFADGRMKYTGLGNAGIYLFRDGKLRKLTGGNVSHNADNADKIDIKSGDAEAAAPEAENIKAEKAEAGNDFQPGVPDADAAGRTEPSSDNFYENYEGSEGEAEIHIPESVSLPEEERIYSDEFELDGKLIFALPEYQDLQLMKGDKILVCGEGVFSHISKAEIKEILNSKDSVSEKVGALVAAARKNSAGVDMTAVLIEVEKDNKFAAFIGEMNATRYIGLGLILSAIIIVLIFYLPVLLNHSPTGSEPTPVPVPVTFSPAQSPLPTPDAVITGREETSPTPSNTAFLGKITPSPSGGSTGIFPGRTDEPKPTDTAVPTSTPNPTQTSQPTTAPRPTPVPTPRPTPVPTPRPTPVPTPRPTPPLVPPTPTGEPEPTDEPPVTQEPPTEEPPTGEPPTGEPPTGEPPTEEPPTGEPPTEQPPTEEPPTGEPPTEEPPSEEPPSEEPPGE